MMFDDGYCGYCVDDVLTRKEFNQNEWKTRIHTDPNALLQIYLFFS